MEEKTEVKEKTDMKEYYTKRREELSKIRSDSIDSYDKTILQLSTGALAITITFLEKIGKPYNCFTNVLITISWISFLLVVILNLLSFYFAKKNMDFKIKDLDERYTKHLSDGAWSIEQFSGYKTATEFCTGVTLWLFLAATILFVIYAIVVQNHSYIQTLDKRTQQEVIMSKKKEYQKAVIPEAVPPKTVDKAVKAQTETPEPIITPPPEPKKTTDKPDKPQEKPKN